MVLFCLLVTKAQHLSKYSIFLYLQGKIDVPVVAGTARVPKRKKKEDGKKEDAKRQFKKMEKKAADSQVTTYFFKSIPF